MFSQEAARQTEISPYVYQGELPVIRPSPHISRTLDRTYEIDGHLVPEGTVRIDHERS